MISTTGRRGGRPALRPSSTAVRHATPSRVRSALSAMHPLTGCAAASVAGGSAGGRFPGMGIGGAGAQYQNTTLAKIGQKGSELPPLTTGSQATWKAGSAYEVGWTVRTRTVQYLLTKSSSRMRFFFY
jgi:hypothetical protein